METLILPAIHVSILFGFLFYKLKSPMGEFIQNRYKEVFEGLNKAKTQVAEAEAKRKEIDTKLSFLNKEKEEIFKEWKERESLQTKGLQESSARIIAQMKIESEKNKKALEEFTKNELIFSMGSLTLELAKKKVIEKLNAASHQHLNEKFSKEVAGA